MTDRELAEVIAFLLGEAEINGKWFGDRHPGDQPYWWRKHLRAAWNRRTPAGEDARDAERWRYIAERAPTTIRLDGSMSNPEWAGLCPSYFRGNTADELDAAIDAARREG